MAGLPLQCRECLGFILHHVVKIVVTFTKHTLKSGTLPDAPHNNVQSATLLWYLGCQRGSSHGDRGCDNCPPMVNSPPLLLSQQMHVLCCAPEPPLQVLEGC